METVEEVVKYGRGRPRKGEIRPKKPVEIQEKPVEIHEEKPVPGKKRMEVPKKRKRIRCKLGRPKRLGEMDSILEPNIAKMICHAIRIGSCPEVAAESVGINRQTLVEWLKRGTEALAREDPNDRLYIKFALEVRRALAAAETRDLKRIDNAADKHWQAAAWKLERRTFERWGPKHRQEITGPGGAPIQAHFTVDALDLSLEVRKQILEAIRNKNQKMLAQKLPAMEEINEVREDPENVMELLNSLPEVDIIEEN